MLSLWCWHLGFDGQSGAALERTQERNDRDAQSAACFHPSRSRDVLKTEELHFNTLLSSEAGPGLIAGSLCPGGAVHACTQEGHSGQAPSTPPSARLAYDRHMSREYVLTTEASTGRNTTSPLLLLGVLRAVLVKFTCPEESVSKDLVQLKRQQ